MIINIVIPWNHSTHIGSKLVEIWHRVYNVVSELSLKKIPTDPTTKTYTHIYKHESNKPILIFLNGILFLYIYIAIFNMAETVVNLKVASNFTR